MSHVQFCLAQLYRTTNRKCDMACRATILNSRATSLPNRAVLYSVLCSVQLYGENAVNADWSILFMRRSVRHAQLHTATLSR